MERFESLAQQLHPKPWVNYREAATPRSHVWGHIYTSTEHDPQSPIFLHNENSHVTSWAERLFFYCARAPAQGGETPIADCRRVYRDIDSEIVRKFETLGWQYVRTFGRNLGLPWQKALGLETRAQVDAYCYENFMIPSWEGDTLRLRYKRWTAIDHPITAERCWFNHGLFYNVWCLTPEQKHFVQAFGVGRMPYNTAYGDGTAVPDEVLAAVHSAYAAAKTMFRWQSGDVLMIDNMLVCHEREAFVGDRAVYVGMTGPVSCQQVVTPDRYRL